MLFQNFILLNIKGETLNFWNIYQIEMNGHEGFQA